MQSTPQSNRLHVAIFGETNSGKSALFNAILGTDIAIVSDISGTTTDPISKSMELIPFGPIVLIDTAGINDKTALGKERMKKTRNILDRIDFALYTINPNSFDKNEFEAFKKEFDSKKIPYMVVITKKDEAGSITLDGLKNLFKNSFAVSVNDKNSIEQLKLKIADELKQREEKNSTLLGDLLPEGSTVILVIPVDSEAPRGRLILPQVQLIRDCLDHGIRCNVTTEVYLKDALEQSEKVDLVVTDSQAFAMVSKIVPNDIKLTSFSILMARQKGDIDELIAGAEAIKNLKDNSNVLIAEVCTHNKTHEDIGAVKIPNGLMKATNKKLNIDFCTGKDFPEDLEKYDLVVHCGACMITPTEMKNRIAKAKEKNVSITNYGVTLAYITGILDRSIEILKSK